MKCSCAVVLCVLLLLCECQGVAYKFPEWFKFGAASAAYQVEGGWNASDKGESIWDHLVHSRPELIAGRDTGDVACDSYHLWRRDIEMAEELGLDMYRFSISWSRLLPSGFPNIISEDGKRYYNALIDGLLEKGIEPVVTLHHFDLPQSLQDLAHLSRQAIGYITSTTTNRSGAAMNNVAKIDEDEVALVKGGWANPLSPDWFADYAEVVFSLYADRVKIWLTMNELIGVCDNGYNKKAAPNIDDLEIGRYLCNKYTLIAHAKAYRIYDEMYRPKYNGKVSLTNVFLWFEPATPDDVELTELTLEFWEGRYSHPIFSKKGGWPSKLEQFLLESGKKEGYPYPRLPPFTAEETELVRGTYDFYALNHYTTRLIRKVKPGEVPGEWPFFGSKELNMTMESNSSWKPSDLPWLSIYPEGLRSQLHWLHTTYDVKEIMILENGLATFDPGLNDTIRLEYIRDHLEQILLAINDGIPVTGYTAWTIMDNFEWFGGYSAKFGLYAVDFNDPNRTRTPRESALFYANVVKSRTIHTTNKQYQPL